MIDCLVIRWRERFFQAFCGCLFSMNACQSVQKDIQQNAVYGKEDSLDVVVNHDVLDTFQFISDKFANNPFLYKPTMDNMSKLMPTCKRYSEVFVEPQTQGKDSIITYNDDSTTFSFYKTFGNAFFTEARIFSPEILLKDSIKIGISKNDFLQNLHIDLPVSKDIIVVRDSESVSQIFFFFHQQKLYKIEINTIQ